MYGQDSGTSCLAYASLALWHLGYPDQALQRSHQMLRLAHELSHPFSLAHALYFASLLHQHRREVQEARECADALIALSNEPEPTMAAAGQVCPGFSTAGTDLRLVHRGV
jgi:hypothetical protein